MILNACETPKTPDASILPAKPMAAMEPCNELSFFEEMQIALNGAQGIREDWLMDYAARAEGCQISHDTLVGYLDLI